MTNISLSTHKLEELISAVDKIVDNRQSKQLDIFPEEVTSKDISKTLGIPLQDSDKSYNLYYNNIQNFMSKFLPKDDTITKPIRNLLCTLLSHHEKSNIKSGTRGGDSRMASTKDMEHIIDVLSEWSETPHDYMKLSNILLAKNIELGYIPEERSIQDYL